MSKRIGAIFVAVFLLICAVYLVFTRTSLFSVQTNTQFETISKNEHLWNKQFETPQIWVVSSLDDVQHFTTTVLNAIEPTYSGIVLQERLSEFDYTDQVVIVVGQDVRVTNITIESLSKRGGVVYVNVSIEALGTGGPGIQYNPSHIIKFPREAEWNGTILFRLTNQGLVIAETQHVF